MGSCELGTESLGSVKRAEFSGKLSDYQILQKDSTP
jgi:hypothetical protein